MVAPGKGEKVKPAVYHEDEVRRGWRIVHQKLSLQVDLTGHALRGTAKFGLHALNSDCTSVSLNLRRCRVSRCSVNGVDARHEYASPLDDKPLLDAVSTGAHPHRNEDVKREADILRTWATDWGELVVYVPTVVRRRLEAGVLAAARSVDSSAEHAPSQPTVLVHKLPALSVEVTYEVHNPAAGASFQGSPEPEHIISDPLHMLTESRYGLVRTWMPCIDSLRWCDRCFFDLDVIVPPDQTAVASGDLVAKVLQDDERIRFEYRGRAPIHAHEVALAVGPFMAYPDPVLPKSVTHFCLPGHAQQLVHTSPPLFAKALAFCRDYFGFDPPCTSFKQVFVGSLGDEPNVSRCAGGGIAIFSGDLLHDARNIDAGFKSREVVMSVIVQSYIGCLLRPRTPEDAWIISGLHSHVTNLGLRTIFGSNWYRFRIMDEMEALHNEKPADSVKLAQVEDNVHLDITSRKVRRRALAVVYMIERRIGRDIMQRAMRDIVAESRSVIVSLSEQLERCAKEHAAAGLQLGNTMHSFIAKAFGSTSNSLELQKTESAAEEEEEDTAQGSKRTSGSGSSGAYDDGLLGLSVHHFLKRLRAICGTDVRNLARSWAQSIGVHRLRFAYRYNARRHIVEFVAVQENAEDATLQGKPTLPFVGSINVRVMEVEGANDHQVDIRELTFQTDLSLMSRRTKRSALADKDSQQDPLKWTPVSFVRVDPDQEWCMEIRLDQPHNMLITMLQSDRDAIGQYRACRELAHSQNPDAARALAAVLEDDQVYWRVQAEAANSLATCKGGLEKLLEFCRQHYTDRGDDGRENVRRNDFSNFAEYYVKRAIVSAIVKAKNTQGIPRGKIHPDGVNLIMELLKGNDNAGNTHDDDAYVSDLIRGVGTIAKQAAYDLPQPEISKLGKVNNVHASVSASAVHQIEKYVALDRLMPSKTGAVTCALLRALSEFEIVRLATYDKRGWATPLRDLVHSRHRPNRALLRLITRHCAPQFPPCVRIEALRAFALVYSGELPICEWLLSRVDSYASGTQIIDATFFAHDDVHANQNQLDVCESPHVRIAVMRALNDAVTTRLWGTGAVPPLVTALRRDTQRAQAVCIRILKLLVGDVDIRIRDAAWEFASVVWGLGQPVCLLSRAEYNEALRSSRDKRSAIRDVVPASLRTEQTKVWKSKRPAKSKNSKTGKHGRSNTAPQPIPASAVAPTAASPKAPPPLKPVAIKPVAIKPPMSKPAPAIPKVLITEKKMEKKPLPPVPISAPIPLSKPLKVKTTFKRPRESSSSGSLSFKKDELDAEDLRYMKMVLDEEKARKDRESRKSDSHERRQSRPSGSWESGSGSTMRRSLPKANSLSSFGMARAPKDSISNGIDLGSNTNGITPAANGTPSRVKAEEPSGSASAKGESEDLSRKEKKRKKDKKDKKDRKKKKRRREGEHGEDDEERRKKKAKKHKEKRERREREHKDQGARLPPPPQVQVAE